jgi:hypothetical protein
MLKTKLQSKGFRRGQIAVALMLVMIPLLGVIGLGTDLGLLFFHWGIVQKAADAAVLAGAGYLPNHPSTAQNQSDRVRDPKWAQEQRDNFQYCGARRYVDHYDDLAHGPVLFPAISRCQFRNSETDGQGRDSARR